ncbi:hypothetical protein GH714_002724 [Hevea brasiliensis]|uniref:Uncharacterized protein n=1 Tax=Hevea brasiliensis TaxID=3981 RepID=A0A6A6KG81_HEVBR|nr:hypothetical protein GH714_002724 [Hevea brasiliensis]
MPQALPSSKNPVNTERLVTLIISSHHYKTNEIHMKLPMDEEHTYHQCRTAQTNRETLNQGESSQGNEVLGKPRKPETCLFRKQFLATRTRPGTDDGEKEEEDKSNRSLPEVKALREKGDDKLEKTEEKAPAVDVRGDDDEWCKDSDVSVVSGQLLLPEEDPG